MQKVIVVSILAVTLALCSGWKAARAQDSPHRPDQAEKPVHAYRLDFSLNELAGEKKVNSRHYSISLDVPGDRQEVKIGTRVPVATGSFPTSTSSGGTVSTQFQYLDIGTHIWCSLKDRSDELELQAGSEISNIDTGPRQESSGLSNPVVRQIKMEGSTVVVPGKPIVIGSADDPTSDRQFQLEVTVTRLK
ncbi:MAG: hypothetical protein WCA20_22505 [Candidatus Sulfotelmatobacter sp.]